MSSTFFGFNIARSGLFASQRALHVTSHNIANANTEGYTRQRLDIKQSSPMALSLGKGVLGTGVETENITQLRNEFLDFKFRGENSGSGEWEAKAEALQNIEAIFNEPSDSGIRTVLDQFFSSLHELNKTPESLTARALVRQRSIALAKNINNMASQFEKMQSDTDFEIRTVVDEINGYADQIAKLNDAIFNAELDGSKANDLRDQRNLLLDKLSNLTDIDYYEDGQNRFHVLVNGKALVANSRSSHLAYSQRANKLNPTDARALYNVTWDDGSSFQATGGKIKGLIEIRDNADGSDKGIPYYMEKLDEFADVLTEELNRVHKMGYDLDGSSGTNLFTINRMSTSEYENYLINKGLNDGPGVDVTTDVLAGTSTSLSHEENNKIIKENIQTILGNAAYENKSIKMLSNGNYLVVDRIPASELTLSADIEDDLNKLAASSTQDGIPGNGDNALNMSEVRHDVSLYKWGSPDDFVKSLISNLGVDTQEAIRMRENKTVLLDQVNINRQSVSGVSLDEEMANMIQFQHSFNANSRMITAMDEMIETIISRMGLVGR